MGNQEKLAGKKSWYLFDDSRMQNLGDWSNVIDVCLRKHYQPTLLFFEQKKALTTIKLEEQSGYFMNWQKWKATSKLSGSYSDMETTSTITTPRTISNSPSSLASSTGAMESPSILMSASAEFGDEASKSPTTQFAKQNSIQMSESKAN